MNCPYLDKQCNYVEKEETRTNLCLMVWFIPLMLTKHWLNGWVQQESQGT